MTVEEMLKRSGDFGPAQWWLLSLFCATNIISSFHYFSQTFISMVPDNLCVEQILNCTSQNCTLDTGWNEIQFKTLPTEVSIPTSLQKNLFT